MKIINFDFSNIITDSEEYNPTLLLKMIKNKEDLCLYKSPMVDGIGYRYIDDDVSKHQYLEFVGYINIKDNNFQSLFVDINKDRAIFHDMDV